ncbi:Retron-type RNA-directed DNA polymerase [Bacillus sp. ZZV12-4809]|nr:Retron-type RNA-directed DNA polymerase [Bacillus sp. ZZV12-4809]
MPLERLLVIDLNIPHGNGAFVVVRNRESLLHGEGRQFTSPIRIWGGSRGTMRNPEVLLGNLKKHSSDENYKYQQLYRNLYNRELLLLAYQNISGNAGAMTPGIDCKTVSEMSLERLEQLIARLKNSSYQPNPVRRTHIPKKNGGKRPLGLPSADDKVVQEAVRMMLEAIYEGSFTDTSHGFRPNLSCHTALSHLKANFTGTKWFVEGDIKGFFDNIDHHILVNLLRKRVRDERFIDLIWKFLRAGYVEDWKWNKTYSGAPQGGIISPILSNVYLNELDKFMIRFANSFNTGIERKKFRPYLNAQQNVLRNKKKLREKAHLMNDDEKIQIKEKIRHYENEWRSMPAMDPMDSNYRRIQYVRYADDFIVGVIGSKSDAESVKQEITNFLYSELKLELSQDKTLITHNTKEATFLGYEITVYQPSADSKKYSGLIKLEMPRESWVKKLQQYQAIEMTQKRWKSTHRAYLVPLEDIEIVSTYNAEIRGLYNYYKLAVNVGYEMHKFYFFMKWSFLKTMANKYRSKVSEQHRKYHCNGRLIIRYETKKGLKERAFYDEGFKRNKSLVSAGNSNIDRLADTFNFNSINSFGSRLKAKVCEACGATNKSLQMHHTKRLKDLKGKNLTRIEFLMIARNRKTVAVCEDCHLKYHHGNHKH